jgi:hypothetical protein
MTLSNEGLEEHRAHLGAHPGHRPVMLTLTARNRVDAELNPTLKAMRDGFARLRKRKRWKAIDARRFRAFEVTSPRPG